MIKRFESFINENSSVPLDMDYINKRLGDPVFVRRVKNVLNALSLKNKSVLKRFVRDTIDLDKIQKIINRYNFFRKIKNIDSNDPNKIADELEGRNESMVISILAVTLIVAIIGIIVGKSLGDDWRSIFEVTGKFSIFTIIIATILIIADESSKPKVYIFKDGEKYELELIDEGGNKYKAVVKDTVDLTDDWDKNQ